MKQRWRRFDCAAWFLLARNDCRRAQNDFLLKETTSDYLWLYTCVFGVRKALNWSCVAAFSDAVGLINHQITVNRLE